MKLKLTLFFFTLLLFNCNTESKPQLNYKYVTGETSSLTCKGIDMKLFEEALLSFEDDIINHYTPGQDSPSRAYSQFMRGALRNNVKYSEVASEHSLNIYKALEAEKNLWKVSETKTELNYNHPIFDCIGKNIKNNDTRRTYNALITTNSMSMRMIGNELQRKAYNLKDDKYAAVFAVLITYYKNFHNVDFSKSTIDDKDGKN